MEREEIFKLMALMLRYPTKELIKTIEQLPDTDIEAINQVINFFKENDELTIQQEYVKSFDLNDKATLYLTYHRFRDDPKRGTYLAKLVEYFRNKGFEYVDDELPDFLPVILEFVSYMPQDIGNEILKSFEKELTQIKKGLEDVNSKYTPLIDFIIENISLREVKKDD